jgi:hypothetical protein
MVHLSSFSRKRSGTKEAVQPSQLRKQSLVGSILDGWTTKVDIRFGRRTFGLRRAACGPPLDTIRPSVGIRG